MHKQIPKGIHACLAYDEYNTLYDNRRSVQNLNKDALNIKGSLLTLTKSAEIRWDTLLMAPVSPPRDLQY